MKKITPEEYKKAIKAKYDVVKENDISGMLAHPTPGNIRNLCALIAGTKTLKDDESLLKRFFNVKENEDLVKQIEKSDIDKLKPVGHFLKGKTKDAKPIIIELIALLIDFAPRPYSKFSKIDKGILDNEETTIEITETEIPANEETEKEPKNTERVPIVILVNEKAQAQDNFTSKDLNGLKGSENFTEEKPKMSIRKKIAIGVSVLVTVFSVGYTTKHFISREKQCMSWNGDHYEMVDCNNEQVGFANLSKTKPYSDVEFNRKKLKVCDTTTFFTANNQPIVWYSKQNNLVEFFNMDGEHPVTSCELKRVTQHMIDKYVKPCN